MAGGTRGKKSSKTPAKKAATRKTSARTTGSRNGVAARAHKWVYSFNEGSAAMRDLLGGKGAGVAEMTRAGLPVPPGFTITTEACNAFYARGAKFPEGLWEQVEKALRGVEKTTGKGFGDPRNPLLVSVRSGAKFSMPGMMDTVLNLGLNTSTLEGLAALTKDGRFALDAHRRFIQLFSKIVLGINGDLFEEALGAMKQRKKAKTDADLSAPSLEELIKEYRAIVKRHSKTGFPEDPMEQLRAAIGAVF